MMGMSRRCRQATEPGLVGPSFLAGSKNGHFRAFWRSDMEGLGEGLSPTPRLLPELYLSSFRPEQRRDQCEFQTLQPQPLWPWLFRIPAKSARGGTCREEGVRKESVSLTQRVLLVHGVPFWPPLGKGESLRLVHCVWH